MTSELEHLVMRIYEEELRRDRRRGGPVDEDVVRRRATLRLQNHPATRALLCKEMVDEAAGEVMQWEEKTSGAAG